jgi:hypothetical protein
MADKRVQSREELYEYLVGAYHVNGSVGNYSYDVHECATVTSREARTACKAVLNLEQEDDSFHSNINVAQAATMFALSAWIIAMNSVGLVSIRRSTCFGRIRASRGRAPVLLQNLIVSDVVVAIAVCFMDGVWMLSIDLHGIDYLCKAYKFLQAFALYLSAYSAALVTLERAWEVTWPLNLGGYAGRIKICLIMVWIGSLLLSAPQVS